MTADAATYDLVVILDPQVADDARAKIVRDARSSIEGGGSLVRHDEWGERALTYPIEKHATGEYHLLQFHPSGAELLNELDRTLRITDGVLRFRIIKLAPGTPSPPDMRSAAAAPKRAEGEAPAPQDTPAAPAPAEVAAESAAADSAPAESAASESAAESAAPAPAAEAPAPEGESDPDGATVAETA
jgi:small subunit ribosomal protein S6